jgi:hypothetical protein
MRSRFPPLEKLRYVASSVSWPVRPAQLIEKYANAPMKVTVRIMPITAEDVVLLNP